MINFFLGSSSKKRPRPVDEEEEQRAVVEENDVDGMLVYSQKDTLAQKITNTFPDAAIDSPNVVIVGAQNVGKTMLVISLVFHHLINESFFTDEIGERLLKLLHTGPAMATRRPTTIHLSSGVDLPEGSSYLIRLELGDSSAEYSSSYEKNAEFDALLDVIWTHSTNSDSRVYIEPAILRISAANLPNISFTDLPGIRTNDQMSDSNSSCGSSDDGVNIRTMVSGFMSKPETIIFAVEAASCEDFATSHIAPLIKSIEQTRRNVFEHAVLVLSKCDKIKAEGNDGVRVVSLINGTSPILHEYPYKYAVGVINDIDDCVTETDIKKSYTAFKARFKKIKDYERVQFAAFKILGESLNTSTQCTTSAVFHRMEEISCTMLTASMKHGLEVLDKKIKRVKSEILEKLAPPLSYYEDKSIFFTELINNVEYIANSEFAKIFSSKSYYSPLIEDPADASNNGSVDNSANILDSIVIPDFKLGDWFINQKRVEALNSLKDHVITYIRGPFQRVFEETFELSKLSGQMTDSDKIDKCLSRVVSPVHRVDRFYDICLFIREEMRKRLPQCLTTTISEFGEHADYDVKSFALKVRNVTSETAGSLLDSWTHIAAITLIDNVSKSISSMIGKWDGNSVWLESEDFSKTRARLEGNFHRLLSQRLLLEQCLTASVPLPAPPLESITGSSGSSSSEDNSASLCNTTSISSIVGSDNTTLRTAIDDAATSKSTLPTETWSSSFYAEFWRETSQQRLSYVEEKNLALATEASEQDENEGNGGGMDSQHTEVAAHSSHEEIIVIDDDDDDDDEAEQEEEEDNTLVDQGHREQTLGCSTQRSDSHSRSHSPASIKSETLLETYQKFKQRYPSPIKAMISLSQPLVNSISSSLHLTSSHTSSATQPTKKRPRR